MSHTLIRTAALLALAMAAVHAQTETQMVTLNKPEQWQPDGLGATWQDGVVTLTGAGFLKLKPGVLTAAKVGGFTRLIADFRFEGAGR